MSKQSNRFGIGEQRKTSLELFTLTYGAFVAQLVKDYESVDEVNKQLDQIGYNMGVRMVEDFLARTPSMSQRCADMRETADVLAKQAFKMFLNVTPTIAHWNAAYDEFSLLLDPNPLVEFVELPDKRDDNDDDDDAGDDGDQVSGDMSKLCYSQVICGAIRGALEMVQLRVECFIKADQLKGDANTEIRVKFKEVIEDAIPIGED